MDGVAPAWRLLTRILPGSRALRRVAGMLAIFGVVTLLGHELEHYVHADAPEACAFAYIANSVPPAPPPLVVPPPAYADAVAWALSPANVFSSCTEKHRSARGPPQLLSA
jgi:hypothetical protein